MKITETFKISDSMIAAANSVRAKSLVTEAAPEVNELSKSLLGRYTRRAATDMAGQSHNSGFYTGLGVGPDPTPEDKKDDEFRHKQAGKRIINRSKGISASIKRLATEDEEVNEVSKTLLKRYLPKARDDHWDKSIDAGISKHFNADQYETATKKLRQRSKGISTAERKIGTRVLATETVGVNEGLRLLKTYTSSDGKRSAKVYKDADWSEHRTKHYENGVHQSKADYHDDATGCHDQAKHFTGVNEDVNEVSDHMLHRYIRRAIPKFDDAAAALDKTKDPAENNRRRSVLNKKHDTMAKVSQRLFAPRLSFKEDVQIDEISKPTLGRYINKAHSQSVIHNQMVGYEDGVNNDKHPLKISAGIRDRAADRALKRQKGILQATKRLVKEGSSEPENVIMQLRKNVALGGEKAIKFGDGSLHKVSSSHSSDVLDHYNDTPHNDKSTMQNHIAASHSNLKDYKNFKKPHSAGVERRPDDKMPPTVKNSAVNEVSDRLRSRYAEKAYDDVVSRSSSTHRKGMTPDESNLNHHQAARRYNSVQGVKDKLAGMVAPSSSGRDERGVVKMDHSAEISRIRKKMSTHGTGGGKPSVENGSMSGRANEEVQVNEVSTDLAKRYAIKAMGSARKRLETARTTHDDKDYDKAYRREHYIDKAIETTKGHFGKYKSKHVPGLYTMNHREHPDGSFVQRSVSDRGPWHHTDSKGNRTQHDKYEDLVAHINKSHS